MAAALHAAPPLRTMAALDHSIEDLLSTPEFLLEGVAQRPTVPRSFVVVRVRSAECNASGVFVT